MDPSSPETHLYLQAIQCLFWRKKHIYPTLQDNVLLLNDFAEHIYHVGSSHDLHSINPVWIDSARENVKKGRHAVFFTVVNPMFVDQHKEVEYDLTKPRIAVYKNKWKVHQNAVYWCNLWVAQSKGLQFYQDTIHNTLPRCVHQEVGEHEVRRRIVQ